MALFNIKTNKWVHHYTYESLKSVGFQGRRISRQYIDNKGVLWISSDLDLAVLNPDDQGFVAEKFSRNFEAYRIRHLGDFTRCYQSWLLVVANGIRRTYLLRPSEKTKC